MKQPAANPDDDSRGAGGVATADTSPHPVVRLAETLPCVERVHQTAALARYKTMYERASELAKVGVWECDLRTLQLSWTDGVYDMFGIPRDTPVTREQTIALYDPESCREMERARAEAIATCSRFSVDARITTPGGQSRWIRISGDVESENGVPIRIFGLKQDVTAERVLLDRLRRLAEYDPLTGLANRAVFQERFLDRAGEPMVGPLAALLLVDLDAFKQTNDRYGHLAGDECLRQIGSRLRDAFPDATMIARIGGDEFAVLIPAACDPLVIEGLVERALALLAEPIRWRGRTLSSSASIGAAFAPHPTRYIPSDLFLEADSALYAAKSSGRNAYRAFTPQISLIRAAAPGRR